MNATVGVGAIPGGFLEQRVINKVGRGIKRLVQFRLAQNQGLRQQAPEKTVHHASQCGDVHF